MGQFLHLHRVKLTLDRIQVENRLTFVTVIVPETEDWIPSARFHFKTFLVPVLFPVVTTSETAGT